MGGRSVLWAEGKPRAKPEGERERGLFGCITKLGEARAENSKRECGGGERKRRSCQGGTARVGASAGSSQCVLDVGGAMRDKRGLQRGYRFQPNPHWPVRSVILAAFDTHRNRGSQRSTT